MHLRVRFPVLAFALFLQLGRGFLANFESLVRCDVRRDFTVVMLRQPFAFSVLYPSRGTRSYCVVGVLRLFRSPKLIEPLESFKLGLMAHNKHTTLVMYV